MRLKRFFPNVSWGNVHGEVHCPTLSIRLICAPNSNTHTDSKRSCHCTVKVTVVVCVKLPDVSLTVIVEVPAGVPVGAWAQPTIPTAAISATATYSAGLRRAARPVLHVFASMNSSMALAKVHRRMNVYGVCGW